MIDGDWKAARPLVEEARVLSKALGDVHLHDRCEAQLASIAFEAGQTAETINRAREAVRASHRHGGLMAEFLALHRLAAFLMLDDQIGAGRAAALRAFELSRALGNVVSTARSISSPSSSRCTGRPTSRRASPVLRTPMPSSISSAASAWRSRYAVGC